MNATQEKGKAAKKKAKAEAKKKGKQLNAGGKGDSASVIAESILSLAEQAGIKAEPRSRISNTVELADLMGKAPAVDAEAC